MVLELGSDYSSEFEEVEVSEMVSVGQEPIKASSIKAGSVSSSLDVVNKSIESSSVYKSDKAVVPTKQGI